MNADQRVASMSNGQLQWLAWQGTSGQPLPAIGVADITEWISLIGAGRRELDRRTFDLARQQAGGWSA